MGAGRLLQKRVQRGQISRVPNKPEETTPSEEEQQQASSQSAAVDIASYEPLTEEDFARMNQSRRL